MGRRCAATSRSGQPPSGLAQFIRDRFGPPVDESVCDYLTANRTEIPPLTVGRCPRDNRLVIAIALLPDGFTGAHPGVSRGPWAWCAEARLPVSDRGPYAPRARPQVFDLAARPDVSLVGWCPRCHRPYTAGTGAECLSRARGRKALVLAEI